MNILDILAGGAGANPDQNAALNMIAARQRAQSQASLADQQSQMGALDLLGRRGANQVLSDPRFNPQTYDPLAAVMGATPALAQPPAQQAPVSPAPGQPSVPMVQPGMGQAPASPQGGITPPSPQMGVSAPASQGQPSAPATPPPLVGVINDILGPDASSQAKGEALRSVYDFLAPQYKQQLAMYAQLMKAQQGQQNIEIKKDTLGEKVTHDRANEGLGQQRVDATRERTGAILQSANIRAAMAEAKRQLDADRAANTITQQKYNSRLNALGKIASDYSRQATAFGVSPDDARRARAQFEASKQQIADLVGDEPAPPAAPVVSAPPSVGGGGGYKSAADVQAAYKAKKIDYDTAAKALKDNGWAQ